MKNQLPIVLIIICIGISFSFTEKPNDVIEGKFYSTIYNYSHLEKDLILVKKIRTDSDPEYNPEYDEVNWEFDFKKNGTIRIKRLFLYYDGFDVVILEKGNWKKLQNGNYNISFSGISYEKQFTKKTTYECIVDANNGNLKLIPK
jgi:hypothetical protein